MLNYKGIEIRAAEGLHDDCLGIIKKHYPNSANIFEVAGGAGAFSARLTDAGYEVTANDIDNDNWRATDIPKLTMDLNNPLDSALLHPPYDVVVAMEVIEHLQSPSKLLEDCKNLVKKDGYILVSTPNVLDMQSRLIFFRRGLFFHFSPQSYFATGHCTILPYWLLELLFEEAGLQIVERHWGGSHFTPCGWNIKSWTTYFFAKAIKPFMKFGHSQELDANYVIYLLQVKTPGK
jgi:cyclopropane fatty-acyl-phospholipid synthase-like methyltransferase